MAQKYPQQPDSETEKPIDRSGNAGPGPMPYNPNPVVGRPGIAQAQADKTAQTAQDYFTRQNAPSAAQSEFGAADEWYKQKDFGYDPYKQDIAGIYGTQNFDPYRQAALNEADRQAHEQNQGAYNQLAVSGGGTASDRMKLASDFNNSKITGGFAAGQDATGKQNQNTIQTGRLNIARGMDVNAANTSAQNQMLRSEAGADETRRLNLYVEQKERDRMERKLKAAEEIAAAGEGGSDDFLSKMLAPFKKKKGITSIRL